MRTRTFLLLAIVLAAGAAVAGTLTGRWASRQPEPAAPSEEPRANLVIDSKSLNFGEAWETDQFVWTVSVTNQEPTPVEVESFSATCNCLSIEPQSFNLAPGECRDLRLQLDLVAKSSANGEVAVRLTPQLREETSGGKRLGPDWIVSGRVKRVLTVDEVVYLGRHSELAQPLPSKVVPVQTHLPLASLTARSDIPGVIVSVLPPAAGSTTYSVTLTPTKPVPLGPLAGSLMLSPVLQDGVVLPPRLVTIRGSVVSDLEALPPAVQVGGRDVGAVVEEVVVLRSMTARPLARVVAEPQGEGLTAEATEVPGEFRVKQLVRGAGTQTNQVRFSAEVDGRKITIVVPVTYTAIQRD